MSISGLLAGVLFVGLAVELTLQTLANALIGLFSVLMVVVIILYLIEMNSD